MSTLSKPGKGQVNNRPHRSLRQRVCRDFQMKMAISVKQKNKVGLRLL